MNYNPDIHKYDKIINLPHHQSKKRRQMSMTERAAQFGAFRALTGYEEAIAETTRHTDERAELDEYAVAELSAQLKYIKDTTSAPREATATYFVPDAKKSGGAYVEKCGAVRRICEAAGRLVFEDGAEISIDEIVSVEILSADESELF